MIRQRQRQLHRQAEAAQKISFARRTSGLSRRLFYAALAGGTGVLFSFAFQGTLIELLVPSGSQQSVYTVSGGDLGSQLRLCLYAGILLALPALVYQALRYVYPLLQYEPRRLRAGILVRSGILAAAGILVAYALGLPAANAPSYASLAMAYLLNMALLFQIPLVMLFVNHTKPLQPRKLIRHQQWPIFGSLVIGAMLSPTFSVRSQLLMSGPTVIMYEISIVLVWLANHKRHRPRSFTTMLEKDGELQAERLASFQKAHEEWRKAVQAAHRPAPPMRNRAAFSIPRPQQYVQDFHRRPADLRLAPDNLLPVETTGNGPEHAGA